MRKKLLNPIHILLFDVLTFRLVLAIRNKTIFRQSSLKELIYNVKERAKDEWIKRSNQVLPADIDFLFLIIEPTHLKQAEPVLKALANQKILIVTSKRKLWQKLKQEKIPVHYVSQHLSNFKIFSRNKTSKEKFRQEVVHVLQPLLEETDKHLVSTVLLEEYTRINKLKRQFRKILKTTAAKYIFIGNDLTPEGRLMCLMAQQERRLTGMIQHGLIAKGPINGLHIVEQFFVYGQGFKDILTQDKESKADQIIVSGAPYLDKILTSKVKDQPIHHAIKEKFDIQTSSFFLIAFSGFGDKTSFSHYKKLVSCIIQLIKERPDISFIIKLHRKDKSHYYLQEAGRQKLQKINLAPYLSQGLPESIFDWFQGCKAVITGTSTVAIEAMLLDIPVISVDLDQEYSGINFIDNKAAYKAAELKELLCLIDAIDREELALPTDSQSFINSMFYRSKGESATEIITNTALNAIFDPRRPINI